MTHALTFHSRPDGRGARHPRETVAVGRARRCARGALAGVSGATPALPPRRVERERRPAAAAGRPLPRPDPRPSRPRPRCRSTPASRSPAAPIRRRAPFALGTAAPTARARALECLTSAIYYEAGAGSRPTASAPSRRSSSTASATRPSRPASAAWSTKARPAPPAASSPSPATARWPARPMPPAVEPRRAGRRGGARRRRLSRRSATRPIITPIMSCPTGRRAWSRPPSIGAHIFYRWSGGWGRPAAFSDR